MKKIRVLDLAGSYYEMGYAHGKAYADDIRHFAEERVAISGSGKWTTQPLSREEVLAIGEACVAEHEAYAPDLMQELHGMADATGLSLAELVIVNGFTDFVDTLCAVGGGKNAIDPAAHDNCTAFLVPGEISADKNAFYGQTWDMHDTATPYVILLNVNPTNAPSALVFTITGCVGMIGMNDAGIAVGINNLQGADGQIGVTWPFVIRKILQQDNLDDAIACITDAKLAGAHNYMLLDRAGNGVNIEAMSTHHVLTQLDGSAVAHTNHCLTPATVALSRPRLEAAQLHSENRLSEAYRLLGQTAITPNDLMALTRNDTICTLSSEPLHIETCGAAIMQPATGDFWAVWGLPTENEYEKFKVGIPTPAN